MPTRLRAALVAVMLCLSVNAVSIDAHAADNKQVTAEERYELGLKYMKRGNYTKALEHFNRVRNYHRDDPVSVKAELAIADVYFKKNEYAQARLAYEDFARLHPRHEDLDYVTFRLGECLYKDASKVAGRDQSATRQAVNVWTNFGNRFPESEWRDEVDERLTKSRDRLAKKELLVARFYADRKAWRAARNRAEGLVQRFPDSQYVPEAIAIAAVAAHAWGQVAEAQQMREKLASTAPDSSYLKTIDNALAKAPGEPPKEETFVRPYKLPNAGGTGIQTQQQ